MKTICGDRPKRNRNWYQVKAEGHTAEILIYSFIGEDFFGDGVSAKGLLQEIEDMGEVTEINVRINSPGGDVFDGVAIHNALQRHPATINVHIDGLAASIASVIAMAGDTILMASNALMMIHNPHAFAIGDAIEMRKTADLLDKAKEGLVNSYLAHVGDGLDQEEIETMMDETTWFTAEEAVAAGLADEVGNAVKIAAYFDLAQLHYKNIPEPCKNQKPGEFVESVPLAADLDQVFRKPPAIPVGMTVGLARQKYKLCETVSKETPQ